MIIDIHTHITLQGERKLFKALGREHFTAATLVRTMDKQGIDKSVVLPLSNPENHDEYLVAGNMETIRQCRKFPDRLFPFFNLDPRGMLCSPKANFSRLLRVCRDMGCLGIGEICANMPITHPLYQNLFHHAGQEKLPLLFHFTGRRYGTYGARDGIHLPGLEQMLKAFPETLFIGHGPAFWAEMAWDVDSVSREGYPRAPVKRKGMLWTLLAKYPNLYGDISAGSGHNALIRSPGTGFELLEKFSKKLFFGTDRFGPGLPLPSIISLMNDGVKNGKISRRAYENIMGKNFKRVIGCSVIDNDKKKGTV